MAFNDGKPYHGSRAVEGGRLRGSTGPTGYFFSLSPKCKNRQILPPLVPKPGRPRWPFRGGEVFCARFAEIGVVRSGTITKRAAKNLRICSPPTIAFQGARQVALRFANITAEATEVSWTAPVPACRNDNSRRRPLSSETCPIVVLYA